MKKVVLTLAAVLALAAPAAAQTQATQTSEFVWDVVAPDIATARGYTYKVYTDALTTGRVLSPVNCGTISPAPTDPLAPKYVCTSLVGAFAPGSHTATITASNAAGESLRSAPVAFTMIVVPEIPVNLRIRITTAP